MTMLLSTAANCRRLIRLPLLLYSLFWTQCVFAANGEATEANAAKANLAPQTNVTTVRAPAPAERDTASEIELKDHSVLIFGAVPDGCYDLYQCKNAPPPSYRWMPQSNTWETLPDLVIPFESGYQLDPTRAFAAMKWPRADVIVRTDGRLEFLGFAPNVSPYAEASIAATTLFSWTPGSPPMALGTLNLAREGATLFELPTGKLSVVGGAGQKFTESFDELSGKWSINSAPAHYAGGRAVKLANGRIFKLSLNATSSEEGYSSEIADADLSRWYRLWDMPIQHRTDIAAEVRRIGNCAVVLVYNKNGASKLVFWNDNVRQWAVLDPLQGTLDGKGQLYDVAPNDDGRIKMVYGETTELVDAPGGKCQ